MLKIIKNKKENNKNKENKENKHNKPNEIEQIEQIKKKFFFKRKKPTKPTKEELSEPTKPTKPTKEELSKTTKPTKPTEEELSKPTKPTKPTKEELSKPTKPTKPTKKELSKPTKPTKPTKEELFKPTKPTKPTKEELFKPTNPTKPIKEELSKLTNPTNPTEPTEEELSNVELALQKLWKLDANRLNPGDDYTLNLPLILEDDMDFNTEKKLFESVSKRINDISTYKLFYQLLDNYIPQTGIPEVVDDHELKENDAFIKACLKSGPMIYTYKYLKAKKIFQGNKKKFEKELHKIWFDLYKRDSDDDSSAFEHIFVGEVRNGAATAFHNWIMFYFYEKSGKIDYEGFMPNRKKKNKSEKPDPNSHIVTIRFTFEGAKKPYSTSFIGTSPEFELAMYTLLFYLGEEITKVTLDGVELNIKVFTQCVKGRKILCSAFPSLIIND